MEEECIVNDDDESTTCIEESDTVQTRDKSFLNFMLMSLLFSANHGAVTSCLSVAIARLGNVGSIQSGTLYLSYTLSSVLGATLVTKKYGARNALMIGMALYCAYVGCFFVATTVTNETVVLVVVAVGAILGGMGGGFLWTAQGAYFVDSSDNYASSSKISSEDATASLGSVFAFVYLVTEVILKSLSTEFINAGLTWKFVFGCYLVVATTSTVLMIFCEDLRRPSNEDNDISVYNKITVASRLLVEDPKMKYLIGLNASFAFSSTFLASYVSGVAEKVALSDDDSRYVGILSSCTAIVAALCSLLFGRVTQRIGKGPVLLLGALCFFSVGASFYVFPHESRWGWVSMVSIYSVHGIGRATFEGTLRATFADFFPGEKEGAFANIILQSGGSSAIGFFLLPLMSPKSFEWLLMGVSGLAVLGYRRAQYLYSMEEERPIDTNDVPLLD